ncbi:39S ribosomal mitochondrial [Brachionus plicatilis]|uniref:39S ribosomal mitochondrial n=1 Tax=Brachionus plicatilis TaxID=10195 RepID=A0A3M7Q121_BRAPC|nr:39S ribosomal mitochondrial [Brachionus plicatilis]
MNRVIASRVYRLRPLSARLSSYQSSDDRSLKQKQYRFPKLTQQVYVQTEEVATYDGYKIVEPLIDPEQKPHELHLIKKTGKLIGEPWWVKDAMKKLGFKTYMTKEWDVVYNIRPNTPEVNKLLWYCKHVVKILPVTFKNGYPSQKDLGNTKLNLETGEFEIVKELNMNGVKVTEELSQSSSFPLTKKDLLQDMHRKKQLGKLNDEYFPTVYDFKYDQDKPGVIKLKGRPNTNIMEDDVTDEPTQ